VIRSLWSFPRNLRPIYSSLPPGLSFWADGFLLPLSVGAVESLVPIDKRRGVFSEGVVKDLSHIGGPVKVFLFRPTLFLPISFWRIS